MKSAGPRPFGVRATRSTPARGADCTAFIAGTSGGVGQARKGCPMQRNAAGTIIKRKEPS